VAKVVPAPAALSLYLTVTDAVEAVLFAATIVLILKTLPLFAGFERIDTGDVVNCTEVVIPRIVVTPTMFGAAIILT
jgi:hypothetical protein